MCTNNNNNDVSRRGEVILAGITISSFLVFLFCSVSIFLILLMGGCTVSVGAEGRAFYPENDPREGFFDLGGIDGIFSGGGSGGGFATLGG